LGGFSAGWSPVSTLLSTKESTDFWWGAATSEFPFLLSFTLEFTFYGGPGQSPTADLRVRSALLYATELPGHWWVVYRERLAGAE
jgi:hypothetical protein